MESPKQSDDKVQLLDYEPHYQADFKRLNTEWIERYFRLEEADLRVLDHPDEYVLRRGGHILLAACGEQMVGTCALLKMDETSYELGKMAVTPPMQGRGIGRKLAEAAIAKAWSLGARRLYLESNTQLAPALHLYYQLGFRPTTSGSPSPYERSDIQLELLLPT
ncbi:GCN5-related N-acetyltransferase [Hymenobacter roseosalivarius DSM 11622]|uniref:GCN5-related N-acetyltransferase n=1 Tax=Hymenobacter roseosalivarius DSM 11622 TaxID=645990 RepID=A0A1W1UHN8_9BACT|nr:GNAT family N-acetyltransferase [Hymenobacter roseosalivarius]SMB80597.1 GCN5-related N-acetyltransferase [Hymenobacter roseosalivarius DSM 11622]